MSKQNTVKVSQTKMDDPYEFTVTVRERGSETHHRVTMTQATYERLTDAQVSLDSCIRAAFQFLLEREPKESILPTFDVTVISTYFPDFEGELMRYLS